ncbi:MAG: RcnB family protein [Porphyrobacter sp.]|nr:RcnB family protein [Porphyrobacter sp.]
MMKKLVAAIATIALVAPVAAEAQMNSHGRAVSQVARQQGSWHRFKKGERFDRKRAQYYRVINYKSYRSRLRPPPRGFHWVRSGNDALLVAITSGIVASVVSNLFR